MDHDNIGLYRHHGYRREIPDRVVGQALVEPRIERKTDVAEQHGVAVRRRLTRDVGADSAAGAATIVSDDRLAEPVVQPLHQHARDDIGAAAWRERHDQANRLGRIALGDCGSACNDRERGDEDLKNLIHI